MTRLITNRRQSGSIAIVDLCGRIDLGEASLILRKTIRELVASGQTKILLNLCEVESIDSAGVGELVGAYTPVMAKGGALKFLNPTKKVLSILQITQLDKVFEIYTNEQMAIRSFPEAIHG